MKNTDKYREAVLRKIAGSRAFRKIGRVTYEIDGKRVHIKVKSGKLKKYPFNINPAVLSADFEVYVCGSDDLYYVIPVHVIRDLHSDPSAMPDYTHPGLTVIDVYPDNDCIVYGTGGKSLDVAGFRKGSL